jgi:hypothetical protein
MNGSRKTIFWGWKETLFWELGILLRCHLIESESENDKLSGRMISSLIAAGRVHMESPKFFLPPASLWCQSLFIENHIKLCGMISLTARSGWAIAYGYCTAAFKEDKYDYFLDTLKKS